MTKNGKIIMWSSIGVGSILLVWGITKLIKKPAAAVGGTDSTAASQVNSNNTIATGLQGAVKNETGDATANVDTSSGIPVFKVPNPPGTCGIRHTDYDNDFDYMKCDGIWYTISKPNATRGVVYSNWLSLANNAVANQRLNSKYPNG